MTTIRCLFLSLVLLPLVLSTSPALGQGVDLRKRLEATRCRTSVASKPFSRTCNSLSLWRPKGWLVVVRPGTPLPVLSDEFARPERESYAQVLDRLTRDLGLRWEVANSRLVFLYSPKHPDPLAEDAPLRALRDRLFDNDRKRREAATASLLKQPSSRALVAFEQALVWKDARVQADLLRLVPRVGASAAPLLERFMRAESSTLRSVARRGLVSLGPPALPFLTKELASKDARRERQALLEALSLTPIPPAAVELGLKALGDKEIAKRWLDDYKQRDSRRRRPSRGAKVTGEGLVLQAARQGWGSNRKRNAPAFAPLLEQFAQRSGLRMARMEIQALSTMGSPGMGVLRALYEAEGEGREATTLLGYLLSEQPLSEKTGTLLRSKTFRGPLAQRLSLAQRVASTLARAKPEAKPNPELWALAQGLLEDEAAQVRMAVLSGVGYARTPSAQVGELALDALSDANAEVRARAARIVGRLESIPAERLAPLSKLLADSQQPSSVLYGVALALGRLGAPAVPHLLKAAGASTGQLRLRHHPSLQKALERVGAPATPLLIKATHAAEPAVRRIAAAALGGIGAKEALPHLERLFDDPDVSVLGAALMALASLGEAGHASLIQALDHSKREVKLYGLRAIAQNPKLAALAKQQLRLKAQDPDRELRLMALQAISVGRIVSAAPEVLASLKDAEWSVRAAALRALKLIKGDPLQVVPAIAECLADSSPQVVHLAFAALKVHGAAAGPALPAVRLRSSDPRLEVRIAALTALVPMGTAAKGEAAWVLKAAADSDPRIRAAALRALAIVAPGDKEAVAVFVASVKDTNSEVAAAGVAGLGVSESPLASKALLKVLVEESGSYAVRRALPTLGKRARGLLLAALEVETEVGRIRTLVQLLGRIPVKPEEAAELGQLLAAAKAKSVREALLRSIENLGYRKKGAVQGAKPGLFAVLGAKDSSLAYRAFSILSQRCTVTPKEWIGLLRSPTCTTKDQILQLLQKAKTPIPTNVLVACLRPASSRSYLTVKLLQERAKEAVIPVRALLAEQLAVPATADRRAQSEERRRIQPLLTILGAAGPAAAPAAQELAACLLRPSLRVEATLKKIGAPAVPHLVKLLDREGLDRRARERVVRALGTLGPHAVSALSRLAKLATDKKVGYAVSHAMQQILVPGPSGDPPPVLLTYLKSKTRFLREVGAGAFRRWGEDRPDVGPVLLEWVAELLGNEDKEVVRASLAAVRGLGPLAEPLVPKLLDLLGDRRLGSEALRSIYEIGPGVAGPIVEGLASGESQTRWACVRLLRDWARSARRRKQPLEPSLLKAAPKLLELAQGGGQDARLSSTAVETLGWFGPAAAKFEPDLVKLRGAGDENLAARCGAALYLMGGEVRARFLKRLSEGFSDADQGVRQRALTTFDFCRQHLKSELGKWTTHVARMAKGDAEAGLRMRACTTLAQLVTREGGESLAALLECLREDADPLVRARAGRVMAGAVYRLKDRKPLVKPFTEAAADESPRVRAEAATLLGATRLEEARPALEKLLKDEDASVLRAAERAIRRIRRRGPRRVR
jgi:HEAT repeat protein